MAFARLVPVQVAIILMVIIIVKLASIIAQYVVMSRPAFNVIQAMSQTHRLLMVRLSLLAE